MSAALNLAAHSLHTALQDFPWFRMVGVSVIDGNDGLIVYVSRSNKAVKRQIPDTWEGFPVVFRRMSQPTPFAAP